MNLQQLIPLAKEKKLKVKKITTQTKHKDRYQIHQTVNRHTHYALWEDKEKVIRLRDYQLLKVMGAQEV